MSWFKCKHPFQSLEIRKAETIEPEEEDFNKVTYHFKCNKCGADVDTHYSKCTGGVEVFLAKKAQMKREAEENGNRTRT